MAVIEAANHPSDSNFKKSLYEPMELIECHHWYLGLLYDNNVLSTGTSAGNESPELRNRYPNAVCTTRTIELAQMLMPVFTYAYGSWILRCMGFTSMITDDELYSILRLWRNMNETNIPTVHVFEEVHVVSISIAIASGTLIRPVRMLVNNRQIVGEGPFVDSMCVYRSDTMRFISKLFPDPTIEPEQFVWTIAKCIDYNMYTMEPRASLAVQMLCSP
ncbi:hypothetical protein AYO21_11812 [Fonsecaea monophora]|uniref:Uncharacterized protein n=1 Tax=Fonsecaea monophora TaxID=254056 RepID=A0A177EPX6_9EURO|nr:hypothetical protein AYO21_11812 [Fonsecaea monophora]OAG34044.1 hypothetical protein AYO21_11812 [Fonsecaea monophora]